MDLTLYATLFKKYWLLFVGVILVAVGSTVVFTLRQPQSYRGNIYLSVAQRDVQSSDEQDGSYYDIQASSLVVEQLSGWLTEPATTAAALRGGGVDPANFTLQQLGQVVQPKLQGGTGLILEYRGTSVASVEQVLLSSQEVARQKLTSLQERGIYENFLLVPGEPLVREERQNLPLAIALSAVAGAVLAFILLLLLSLTMPEHSRSRS